MFTIVFIVLNFERLKMARRKTKQLIQNTCEVCGKKFYSTRPATVCVKPSTCRVIKHQRSQERQKIEIRARSMSLDALIIHQDILAELPDIKPYLEAFMEKHNMEVYEDLLAIVYRTISCFTETAH